MSTKSVKVMSVGSDTTAGGCDSMNSAPETRRSARTQEEVNCWIAVTIAPFINVPRERLPDVREMITAFISELSPLVQELVDEDPERISLSWREDIILGAFVGNDTPETIRTRPQHWPDGSTKRQVCRLRHAPTHRCLPIHQFEEVLYTELKYVRNRLRHCAEIRRRESALVVVEIDLSSIEIVDTEMDERLLEAAEIEVLFEGFDKPQNDTVPQA